MNYSIVREGRKFTEAVNHKKELEWSGFSASIDSQIYRNKVKMQ